MIKIFVLACLLNINFALLRSARNTIAVADLSGNASLVPLYELFGVFPTAILLTWLVIKLLNHYALDRIFSIIGTLFITFFLIFALFVHPVVSEGPLLLKYVGSSTFYIMAELWKVMMITVLFWALVNRITSLDSAKACYGPLMLASSVGSLCAGPLVSLCTCQTLWDVIPISTTHWGHTLMLIALIVAIVGGLCVWIYRKLALTSFKCDEKDASSLFLLGPAVDTCLKTPELRLLSWIIIADYLAYSLAEVIFLHVLKVRYPDPIAYCHYMGKLSTWSGLLTAVISLCIAPIWLKKYSWTLSAAITPLLVIFCEVLFFSVYCFQTTCLSTLGWTMESWLALCVLLGSIQYTLCRATKYSLMDSSKELAFIGLHRRLALDGKLIIDGIGSRAGRALSSGVTLSLIAAFGSIPLSAPAASLLAIMTSISWLWATIRLGVTSSHGEKSPNYLRSSKKNLYVHE